jgi:hypothetical protein
MFHNTNTHATYTLIYISPAFIPFFPSPPLVFHSLLTFPHVLAHPLTCQLTVSLSVVSGPCRLSRHGGEEHSAFCSTSQVFAVPLPSPHHSLSSRSSFGLLPLYVQVLALSTNLLLDSTVLCNHI